MAFVHPAAVVPLARLRRVDGAALVAGSVGPDVADYFMRLSARPWVHLDPARLLVGGVVGAAALFALVVVAGPGVARALPPFLADRFGPALARPLAERRAAHVAASLVVGLASHVAWDAVTERHGLAHALWPGAVPWRALVLPSTVAGVVILVLGVLLAPRAPPAVGAQARGPIAWERPLVAVTAGALVGAAALGLARVHFLAGTVPDGMAAASAGAIVGVVVAGLAVRAWTGRGAKRTRPGV